MEFRSITFAGHSAIFIDADGYRIAVDPWLNNPNCPAELKDPKKLDLIVLTHGHSDHASDVPMLARRTGAKVAATFELANILVDEGISKSQIIFMNKGGCVQENGISISLVQAFHSNSYDAAGGPVYAGEACGAVLKDANGKNSIYHAGDTSLFSDMKLIAEIHRPTVALLPIGDRFTMGPKDAARAAGYIGAPVVIPIHYGTFDSLSGTPEKFVEACEDLPVKVRVLAPGEAHTL